MKKLLIITILVVFACQLRADTIWTEGHHEINEGDEYWEISMYNDCTLDILGGDIYRLAAYDTTITNWYDGTMDTLWAKENSIVNIYGGQLSFLAAYDSSTVNLYAYDVIHTTTGGFYNQGQVIGKYLFNEADFCFDLLGGQQTLVHLNIVPEPSAFILLASGGFLLRKRK